MPDTPVAAEVFPPGEYLRDELEARDWTVAEFAEILGRPVQAVSEVINGKKLITPETATEIGRALGTSPTVWLNLQNAYQLRNLKAQPERLDDVARRARLRDLVPLAEIRRLGWIPDTDLAGTERAVCRLLGIRRLGDPVAFAGATRRRDHDTPLTPAQSAWLGRVRQLGSRRRLRPYDASAAQEIAASLATRLRDPSAFPKVESWLAKAGVALVIVPALKGSKIDGAAILLPSGTPVVGLSLRWNRFDGAVFTLAHELAHLVLGHIDGQTALLDEQISAGATDTLETEANAQAGRWLFPQEPALPLPPSAADITGAADALGCHPSLVVGRLQWRELVPWSHFRALIPKMSEVMRQP